MYEILLSSISPSPVSPKIMQLNKIQKLVFQLSIFISFFGIPQTYFKSLLIVEKNTNYTENYNVNI